ncbi:hypothetical protein WBK31_15180 [Nonomuraea sp. N2-4H]|uniref:hypothetical protein n=1 Tax=Nonomuraea sp. N2-4H TaxID=3128898 RepID=UPI003246FB90
MIVGLFTRTFQYGTDHLAFHLTDSLGLQTMLDGIGAYYTAWGDTRWHPFRALSGRRSSGGSCWPPALTVPALSGWGDRSRSA